MRVVNDDGRDAKESPANGGLTVGSGVSDCGEDSVAEGCCWFLPRPRYCFWG